MARLPGNLQLIRWTLLPALLTALAVPMYSQSATANSAPIPPQPKVSESTQEPIQPPPAADPEARPATPASPEEIRQAQIEEYTKKLYQLSAELRAEVFRTYKDSLSLSALKKAEEVEKLARSLKVLMAREAASAKQ